MAELTMATPLRIPLLLLAALVAVCAMRPELGRSSQLMLGGLEEADIHEEGVHQAIDYAISVYNQENNDIYYSRVRRVVRARKQVVTGTNYYLDLEIGRTSCSKSQSDLAECPFIERPHEHKVQLTMATPLLLLAVLVAVFAELGRSSEAVLGGLEEADIHEEGVHQAIDYAISVYNQQNNNLYYSRVKRVVQVRKQVVAGMNYYLDLEIGMTSCTKSQSDLAECPFVDQTNEQKTTFCSFEVYIVPWLHTISMTQYSCHNE